MTVKNEGSAIVYSIPPMSIFDLAPYKDNTGEKIICVDDSNSSDIKVGEVFTIVKQINNEFGYIYLDKFKDYPLKWFGRDRFKKLKATYNGIEYTLVVNPVKALDEDCEK